MKTLVSLIAIWLFCTAASAQSNYWSIISSGTDKKLLSISFANGSVGFIGGADSLLLKTTDGGNTWHPVNYSGFSFIGTARDIVHVNFVSPSVGYAVLSNYEQPLYAGNMYKTTDGGATWSPYDAGNINPYRSFFFNEGNGYVVGSAFFSGNTVSQMTSDTLSDYHTFNFEPFSFIWGIDCYNTATIVTCGSNGYVYRSLDGGANWDTVKTSVDTNINSVKFLTPGRLIAATDDPLSGIITSDDTGHTWQQDLQSLTFFYPSMKSVAASAKDSFVMAGRTSAGDEGMIYWASGHTIHYYTADQPLNEVAMLNDSVAFIVGDSGLILTNRDALVNSIETPHQPGHEVKIYPNPSEGLFFVETKQPCRIYIHDDSGRLVYYRKEMQERHTVDIRHYSKGAYMITTVAQDGARASVPVLLK